MLMLESCRSDWVILPQKIHFSDIHNSVISRMFVQDDTAGLERENYAVSRKKIREVGGQFLVLSLGINRFDMQNPETPTIQEAIQFLRDFRKYVAENYSDLVFAATPQDARKIIRTGKTAFVFGLEGTHLLENQIHYIDSLHQVGVRKITFGHRFHNQFVSKPENRHKKNVNGFPDILNEQSVISDEGKKLLEKMIQKQMTIGISHLGQTAFDEILALNQGRTKIVAGHSNARSVCATPRNLTDMQLQKIAKNQGLIGVCLHQPMVSKDKQKSDLQQVVTHILHIRHLVGAKYIAFGTDYEGRITPVVGAEKLHLEMLQKLHLEMQQHGLSRREIQGILSANAVDFFTGRSKKTKKQSIKTLIFNGL